MVSDIKKEAPKTSSSTENNKEESQVENAPVGSKGVIEVTKKPVRRGDDGNPILIDICDEEESRQLENVQVSDDAASRTVRPEEDDDLIMKDDSEEEEIRQLQQTPASDDAASRPEEEQLESVTAQDESYDMQLAARVEEMVKEEELEGRKNPYVFINEDVFKCSLASDIVKITGK